VFRHATKSGNCAGSDAVVDPFLRARHSASWNARAQRLSRGMTS